MGAVYLIKMCQIPVFHGAYRTRFSFRSAPVQVSGRGWERAMILPQAGWFLSISG